MRIVNGEKGRKERRGPYKQKGGLSFRSRQGEEHTPGKNRERGNPRQKEKETRAGRQRTLEHGQKEWKLTKRRIKRTTEIKLACEQPGPPYIDPLCIYTELQKSGVDGNDIDTLFMPYPEKPWIWHATFSNIEAKDKADNLNTETLMTVEGREYNIRVWTKRKRQVVRISLQPNPLISIHEYEHAFGYWGVF